MFTVNNVTEGVRHIRDAMGVCFTLVEGKERAVLFDTGYGTEDVGAYVRTLTGKPTDVLLSHGHHDHMLGARWFPETYLCPEDFDEFRLRSGKEQRRKVMQQAQDNQVPVPADFLTAEIRLPKALAFTDKMGQYDYKDLDLGGKTVRVIQVPGHTPGSIVLYLPEEGLLLTGDDWNPCTWMWFPTSISAAEWRENMKELLRQIEEVYGQEVKGILCSHQPMLRQGNELKEFLDYMTDERMKGAPAVDMGSPINTHQVRNEEKDWTLLFDYDKVE